MDEDYERLKEKVLKLLEEHKESNLHVQVEARYRGVGYTWKHYEEQFGDKKVLKVGIKAARDG